MVYSLSSLYPPVNLIIRSRATSESASMASSMRWPTRSHRPTHQWTWSYVHVQLVSLLQWRAQSRSLQWASRSVSLLQWHCQCDDLSSHRSTHQWTWSYVHVQLVSLLQWRAQSRPLRWASRPVSLLQWHCQCDDLSSHCSTHQWTWSYIHVQLVSLLQWHLPSMRWPIYSHRPTYQWTGLPTRSRATSEPASMALLPRIVSLLQ